MAKRESWLAVNRRRRFAPILVLVLAACSNAKQASQPGAAPSAAPAAQPHARATPRPASGRPAPTARPASTPSPPAAAAPVPSASSRPVPSATPLRLPADAPPQILSVDISETTVHSGDTVSGMVLTSSNVASVEVRVATYGASLAKVGVGRFALQYTLGALPFFVHGTYQMKIIARNTRGDVAAQSVPITVR